jgi:hypothetical protein
MALIRFARRRLSIWSPERSDPEIQKVEFTDRDGEPDLRPSVFGIELKDLIRAYAEYATLRHPLKSTIGINVAGVPWRVNLSPGKTGFRFATDAHREIALRDGEDLLAFIQEIRKDFDNRKHMVEKAQVVEYAGDRLADMDAEWLAAVENARTNKPDSWVAKLSRANSPSGE